MPGNLRLQGGPGNISLGNAMATQASRFSPGARRIAGGRCYNRSVINRFALDRIGESPASAMAS